jgi:hypothetical protein
MALVKAPPRDRIGARTPMRCPVCDNALQRVMIRDIGGVTANLIWQIHAGHCPDHGWFQAEVISTPPREIFPVDRPFGIAQRVMVDGVEIFSFPTLWNAQSAKRHREPVDALDPRWWQVVRMVDAG